MTHLGLAFGTSSIKLRPFWCDSGYLQSKTEWCPATISTQGHLLRENTALVWYLLATTTNVPCLPSSVRMNETRIDIISSSLKSSQSDHRQALIDGCHCVPIGFSLACVSRLRPLARLCLEWRQIWDYGGSESHTLLQALRRRCMQSLLTDTESRVSRHSAVEIRPPFIFFWI